MNKLILPVAPTDDLTYRGITIMKTERGFQVDMDCGFFMESPETDRETLRQFKTLDAVRDAINEFYTLVEKEIGVNRTAVRGWLNTMYSVVPELTVDGVILSQYKSIVQHSIAD